MSDNKAMVVVMLGMMAAIVIGSLNGADDSEQLKTLKAQEKTKQLELQFKIDSLKAAQSKK